MAIKINNHRMFDAMKHHLLSVRKEGKRFCVHTLVSGEKEKMVVNTVFSPVNLENKYLERFVTPDKVFVANDQVGLVPRFTRAYINVRPNAMILKFIEKGGLDIAVQVKDDGDAKKERFFVNVTDVDDLMLLPSSLTENGIKIGDKIDVQTGEVWPSEHLERIKELEKANNGRRILRWYHYGTIGVSSPGQEKIGEITLYCESLTGFDPVKHLDTMTHGAFSLLLSAYKDKKCSLKEMAQMSTRISQFKASMVRTAPIRGIAIAMKKWSDELGNEFADGLQFFSAQGVAKAMSTERFEIEPSVVSGLAMQARPFIVNKGLGMVVNQAAISSIIDSTKGKVIVLAQDEMTDQDIENYHRAVLEKKGPFYEVNELERNFNGYTHNILVIVPSRNGMTDKQIMGQIDVLCDLNVHKTICDFKREFSGFNIMMINHDKEVEDNAKTSTQLLTSLCYADPEKALKLFTSNARKEADKKIDSILIAEGKKLTAADFVGDLRQAAVKAAPEFIRDQWAPWYRKAMEKFMEGITNRLNSMQTIIDGEYCKIIPDVSRFMGQFSLLGYDLEAGECEVYVPSLEKKSAIGVKYPKMCFQEFIKAKLISKETLMARIDALELEEPKKAILRDMLDNLQGGIIMVPAIERLKNMLAGMDFDGDGMVLYTQKEVVEALWSLNPLAVVIE